MTSINSDSTKTDPRKKSTQKEFKSSGDVAILGNAIIQDKRLDVFPAKIDYLLVYPNISKTVPAKIIKCNKEIKFYSDLDYIVEISGDLWDALDGETRSILLEHQLRRILVIQNDKSGDWVFKLRIPDISSLFEKIFKENGTDWLKKIKLTISSLYDLTPAEEDSIKV